MAGEPLDAIDRQLLGLLQQDGRISYVALAAAVGLTAPSVYARVQRLEKQGVIRGYAALVNPAALEQGLLAFIRVQSTASAEEFAAFEQYVLREPQILECHDMAGEDSYLLKARTANPRGLQRLIADIRQALPGSRTITSIVLGTNKEFQASGAVRGEDVSGEDVSGEDVSGEDVRGA